MATRISAHARQIALILFGLGALGAGCRAPSATSLVAVVDLLEEFPRADFRPAGAYALTDHVAGGRALPAISGPAPGRLTWTLPLPRHGRFRAQVTATGPARIRVGVSDARIYEQLEVVDVPGGAAWTEIGADLSAYAGWKLSLFYRPERQAWRLNLSVDADIPSAIALGRPEILAPAGDDAREYGARRARFTRNGAL